MNKELIISQEIEREATQYGIEPSKALNLIGNLPQITQERDILSSQYDEIVKMDIEDPKTSKIAKELRLKIKENRTKGINTWHKTTKEYFLKGGQFVDAIKRKEEAVNVRMEDALEQIEKYAEIKKQKEQQELRTKRYEELAPYRDFVPFGIDLGLISDEEYMKVYNGAKLQQEAKEAADRKAEEERLKAELLQKRKEENRMALMPYYEYIEIFDTLDFANLTEVEIADIIKEAQAKKEKIAAERAEAQKRAEEAERAMEEQRKKADAEKRKMEEKLRKEKEEKDRLQAELKKKEEEEKRREAEEKEKERKLKNASDKVILMEIGKMIANLSQSFPKVKGAEAKEVVAETEAYLSKIADQVKSEAENLTK